MATTTLRPNGDGTYDGTWAITNPPGGSSMYAAIDEVSADDTDYISNNDTSSPYQIQTVTLTDMPEVASAYSSVVMKWRTRCASSTLSTVPVVRAGGTDYEGSPVVVNTTDTEKSWDITSLVSWNDTLINGMEIGWRRNAAASNQLRVSQAWVEITYSPSVTYTRTVPLSAVLMDTLQREVPLSLVAYKHQDRAVPLSASLSTTAILRPADRNYQMGDQWFNEADSPVDLYASLDESSTDDGDYIYNYRPGPDLGRTAFGFTMLPESAGPNPVIERVVLHYRALSDVPGTTIMPFVISNREPIDMGASTEGQALTVLFDDYEWDFTDRFITDVPWTRETLNYDLRVGFYCEDEGSQQVALSQVWVEVTYQADPQRFRPVPLSAHIVYEIIPEQVLENSFIVPNGFTLLSADEHYLYSIYRVIITAMAEVTLPPKLTVTIYRKDGDDYEPESEGIQFDDVGSFLLGFQRRDPTDLDSSAIGVVAEGEVTFSVTCWLDGYLHSQYGA